MKDITAKDLRVIEEPKEEPKEGWKPKFLGMKKEDIHRLVSVVEDGLVCGFDKNGNEIYLENFSGYWSKRGYKGKINNYYENSCGDWWKIDGEDEIRHENGKYYLNGMEAELIT